MRQGLHPWALNSTQRTAQQWLSRTSQVGLSHFISGQPCREPPLSVRCALECFEGANACTVCSANLYHL